MVAYVIVMRMQTKDASKRDIYIPKAQAASVGHALSIRANRGQFETVEGQPAESITILEFPSYEEAKTWYHSPAYQEALAYRLEGANYQALIVDGV